MGYVVIGGRLADVITRLDDEAALLEAAGGETCVVCAGPHHEDGREDQHEAMADEGMSSPAESRTGYDLLWHIFKGMGEAPSALMLDVELALALVGVMTRLTAHMQEQRTMSAHTNGMRQGIHMLTVSEAADGDTVVHSVQVVDGAGKPVAPGVEVVRDIEPTDKPDRSRLN